MIWFCDLTNKSFDEQSYSYDVENEQIEDILSIFFQISYDTVLPARKPSFLFVSSVLNKKASHSVAEKIV